MNNKLKEKLVLFAVSVDEKIEEIKAFIIKYKVLILLFVALISLSIYGLFKDEEEKVQPDNSKQSTQSEKNISEKNSTEGYKVLNNELYQRGIDYYNNTMIKENDLWTMQASVPFQLGNGIKEQAIRKNVSESDMADYYYGSLTSILEDTRENLDYLKNSGANTELIEYEEKILGFIENVHKNYSIDLTLSKEEEDKYFDWIDSKNALSDQDMNEEYNKSDDVQINTDSETYSSENVSFDIKFGTFEEAIDSGDTLVVKAKITSSYSNDATINQNNFNVEDIVKNQGGDKYKEIQYWAIADMTGGSESKVVSFTIDENVINLIANGDIPGNMIMDYATDVWILPSLLK